MASLVSTVGTLNQLLNRFTAKAITEQTRDNAPLINPKPEDKTAFAGGKVIPILDKPQTRGMIPYSSGEPQGIKTIASGGSLPASGHVEPKTMFYAHKTIVGRIEIARDVVKTMRGKDEAIDIVEFELAKVGAGLWRHAERQILATTLGSPTATTAANSSTTVTVDAGASGFVVGMDVDVYSGSTFLETVQITNVAAGSSLNADWTITFTGGGTGGACANSWATTDVFYLHGTYTTQLTSLAVATSASTSIYSTARTADDLAGNTTTSVGQLSVSKMRSLSTIVKKRGGMPHWDCLIGDSINEQRYSDLLLNSRRFAPGQKMDAVGGFAAEFEGKVYACSENTDSADLYFGNSKRMKLHQFWKFGPDQDDAGGGKLILSQNSHTYEMQVSGGYEMRFERPNALGRLAGITS